MIDEQATDFLDKQRAFADVIGSAWGLACEGFYDSALDAYRIAEEVAPWDTGCLNADDALLRHTVHKPNGQVTQGVTATEDRIIFLTPKMPCLTLPSIALQEPPEIDGDALEANIRKLLAEPWCGGYHAKNIREDRPHIMTLSTGRSGTMSLWKLLQDSNMTPHHTYWWQSSVEGAWWMMAAIMDGNGHAFQESAEYWMPTRAAEWCGPKPMIGLNHMDTIFAPWFSLLHEKSKFLYLRRNPQDVFKSFWCKNQWKDNQLMPIVWNIDDGLEIEHMDLAVYELIGWYIKFTEAFCRAFGRVMGDGRFIEIDADKLFAGSRTEIKRMLDFIGTDVSVETAMEHYKTKINEKKHKHLVSLDGLEDFIKTL